MRLLASLSLIIIAELALGAWGGWRWRGGPKTGGSLGNYGQCGVALSSNIPPNTVSAVSWWIEERQELWMFGGHTLLRKKKQKLDTLWSFDARR